GFRRFSAMFTGLVEITAPVVALDLSEAGAPLTVRTTLEAAIGDSIAVNGCCLTVATRTVRQQPFTAMLSPIAASSVVRTVSRAPASERSSATTGAVISTRPVNIAENLRK